MECSRHFCKWFFIFLIWILFSIILTLMGAAFLHKCPIQPLIPKYLIVAGVTNLVIICLQFFKQNYEMPVVIMHSVLGIFAFCWLFAGSVWVFEINDSIEGLCHPVFYDFTYKVMMIQYAVLVFSLAYAISFICLRSCRKKSYDRIKTQQSIPGSEEI